MPEKGKQVDNTMPSNSGEEFDSSKNALAAVMPVIGDLLKRGTRAFAMSNWEEAIEHFGELSSITEQMFGSESQRYADSLVMYGRSLLQYAIEQNALLAQRTLAEAAAGIDRQQEKDAEGSGSLGTTKAKIAFEGEPDFSQIEAVSQMEKQGTGSGSGTTASANGDTEENGNAGGSDERHEEDEEEENDDFAAAWNILDLARVIQSKATDEKTQLKYAETLMLLGDVSLESENFSQAVSDFTDALEVKKKQLGDDDRELAEIYYKVALAHEYNKDSGKALELMADVQRILNNRLRVLEKSSGVSGNAEEAQSLKEVLEDVAAKIEEWKTPQKPVDFDTLTPIEAQLAERAKAMFKEAVENGKINDITSLIKKKNKESDGANGEKEPMAEPSDGKRKSEDNSTNNEATENGNGKDKRAKTETKTGTD